MSMTEKEKKELQEVVQEMMTPIKVSFAVLNVEDPEMGECFLEMWMEELEKLSGKAKANAVAANGPKVKAMVSHPMGGKTDEEIVSTRDRAVKELEKLGYTVVNTLFTDEWVKNQNRSDDGVVSPLWFLAKSLEAMSSCHVVYFCKGWEQARGCLIEHEAAKAYGLKIIYEEDMTNDYQ